MAYTDQFKAYREAKKISRERLAVLADCHRNTISNLETGRPVKFATIAHLMEKMGYRRESAETKLLAFLWLESVAGVRLTESDMASLRQASAAPAEHLNAEIARRKLPKEDIELLAYAAGHRKVLNALRAIRELSSTQSGG